MLHIDHLDALDSYQQELKRFRANILSVIDDFDCPDRFFSETSRLREYFEDELAMATRRLQSFTQQLEGANAIDLEGHRRSGSGQETGGPRAETGTSPGRGESNALASVATMGGKGPLSIKTLGIFRQRVVHLVPLNLVALEANPLTGPESFGPGLRAKGGVTYEQMARSMRVFHHVILPSLRVGATRETFEEADARASRYGADSLSNFFAIYIDGEDPICLTPRSDGRYDITSGRHRIQVAQDLGFRSVPARLC